MRYVNQYGASLLKSTKKEMLGKTLEELFTPDTAAPKMFCLRKVFESGKPFDSEIKLVLPEGEIWRHSRFIPLTSRACEQKLILSIGRDITAWNKADEQRKLAEVELKELNNKLVEMVQEEMGTRLYHERMPLQQSKPAAMGEMLGAIAHQWRQPLSVLALTLMKS